MSLSLRMFLMLWLLNERMPSRYRHVIMRLGCSGGSVVCSPVRLSGRPPVMYQHCCLCYFRDTLWRTESPFRTLTDGPRVSRRWWGSWSSRRSHPVWAWRRPCSRGDNRTKMKTWMPKSPDEFRELLEERPNRNSWRDSTKLRWVYLSTETTETVRVSLYVCVSGFVCKKSAWTWTGPELKGPD